MDGNHVSHWRLPSTSLGLCSPYQSGTRWDPLATPKQDVLLFSEASSATPDSRPFPLTHSKLLYRISLQIKSPAPICGGLQPLQTAVAPWHGRVPLPPPWIPGATSQLCWFPARMTLQARSNPLCNFPTPMTQ